MNAIIAIWLGGGVCITVGTLVLLGVVAFENRNS